MCRLAARKKGGKERLTIREIAANSGILSKSLVGQIAVRTTWAKLTVEEVEAFARGCGVDLLRLEPHLQFLKKQKWSHIFSDRRAWRYHQKLMRLTIA